MKLLYLTQYYPPEVGAGAVRSEVMSRYLASDGWDVDVVCEVPNYPTGTIHQDHKTSRFSQTEDISDTLRIHRVWTIVNQRRNPVEQLLFFLSFMVTSFFYVVCHPKRYDVIYVTSPPIFAGISGYLLSKLFGSKFVFEVRDIWPDSAVNQTELDHESLFIKFGKKIERWLYHNADLIVPVTPAAEQIIKSRSNGTPTAVISNGVDTELFQPIKNPQSGMDEMYNPEKFRVGYVGSLGVIHDLRTFVEAAKLCEGDPDIEFIIVGDGGRNNQLQSIIEEFQPKNLTWVGLKRHEQIPSYISSFDVAINPINPSKAFESIVTVKFYEYLACGVPVITSGKGLMKQIGDESGAAVTVEPRDPVKLSEAIRVIKNDSIKRKELAQIGPYFINHGYSRVSLAKQLSEVLKELG
ncbi:MAG: glycosyltransferase family 4 protein [Balneolaceae bacterium]